FGHTSLTYPPANCNARFPRSLGHINFPLLRAFSLPPCQYHRISCDAGRILRQRLHARVSRAVGPGEHCCLLFWFAAFDRLNSILARPDDTLHPLRALATNENMPDFRERGRRSTR
ncbi:hypothetical protein MAPG_10491, partial [Magnaporthiopsis poae ATCC 64411]